MNNNKPTYTILLVVLILILIGYAIFNSRKESESPTISATSTMSFFVTSINPGRGGDLGGLAGADMYCNNLAENVGVTGKSWKAYLSTSNVDARDRIGNGPWYNAKGELIASNIEELHASNTINKNTALTEKGEIVSGRGDENNIHDILTGSDNRGMRIATTTDTTCNNWTSSSTGSAYVGHHDRVGLDESAPMKSWNSSHTTRGCDLPSLKTTGGAGLFYCFAE